MRRASYAIVLASVLFTASIAVSAQGQGGAAQQPNGFTNLQVWPADTPRPVILNFMNAFNRSLGITCDYCHVDKLPKKDEGKHDPNDRGKWLIAEKDKRHAKAVDGAWLKEYKSDKK